MYSWQLYCTVIFKNTQHLAWNALDACFENIFKTKFVRSFLINLALTTMFNCDFKI